MTPEEKQRRREATKEWYAQTTPEYKAKRRERDRASRKAVLAALRLYKAERGCVDCGEQDPIVLEFDHRDEAEKQLTLAEATARGWSLVRVLQEAAKCDIRCANCHRRKTAKTHWRL